MPPEDAGEADHRARDGGGDNNPSATALTGMWHGVVADGAIGHLKNPSCPQSLRAANQMPHAGMFTAERGRARAGDSRSSLSSQIQKGGRLCRFRGGGYSPCGQGAKLTSDLPRRYPERYPMPA